MLQQLKLNVVNLMEDTLGDTLELTDCKELFLALAKVAEKMEATNIKKGLELTEKLNKLVVSRIEETTLQKKEQEFWG